MRLKRKIFLLAVVTVLLSAGLFFSAKVNAANTTNPYDDKDKYGLQQTARGTDLPALSISKGTPETLAELIVKRVLFFVGTIFFLLILYAGIMWMTAAGSTEKVTTAKQILETAIIGLVIVTASYAIANYVFERFTGVQQEETSATTQ